MTNKEEVEEWQHFCSQFLHGLYPPDLADTAQKIQRGELSENEGMEQYLKSVKPPTDTLTHRRGPPKTKISKPSGQPPMPNDSSNVPYAHELAPLNTDVTFENQKQLIEGFFRQLAETSHWASNDENAKILYPTISTLSLNDILRSEKVGYYARIMRQMGYQLELVQMIMTFVLHDSKTGAASPEIFRGTKIKNKYLEVIKGVYENIEPLERPLKTKPNSMEIDTDLFFPKLYQRDHIGVMNLVHKKPVPIHQSPELSRPFPPVTNIPPIAATTGTMFPPGNGSDDLMVQPGFAPIIPLPMFDVRRAPEAVGPEAPEVQIQDPQITIASKQNVLDVVKLQSLMSGNTAVLDSKEVTIAKYMESQRSQEEYDNERRSNDSADVQFLGVVQRTPRPPGSHVNIDVINQTEGSANVEMTWKVATEVAVNGSFKATSEVGMVKNPAPMLSESSEDVTPKTRFRIRRDPVQTETSSESLTSPPNQNPSLMSTGPTASEILTESVMKKYRQHLEATSSVIQNSSLMASGAVWNQNPAQNQNQNLAITQPLLYARLSNTVDPPGAPMPSVIQSPLDSGAMHQWIPNPPTSGAQNPPMVQLQAPNWSSEVSGIPTSSGATQNPPMAQFPRIPAPTWTQCPVATSSEASASSWNQNPPSLIPKSISDQFPAINAYFKTLTSSGIQMQMPEVVPGANLRSPKAYRSRKNPGYPPFVTRGAGRGRGARKARGARGARGAIQQLGNRRAPDEMEMAIAPAAISAMEVLPPPSSEMIVRAVTLEDPPMIPEAQEPSSYDWLPREAWQQLHDVLVPHYDYIKASHGFAEANRCTHVVPDGLLSLEWNDRWIQSAGTCLLKPKFAENLEFRPVLEELLKVAKWEVEGETALCNLMVLYPIFAQDPNLKVFVDAQKERNNKKKLETSLELEVEKRLVIVALDYLSDMSKTRPITCLDIIAFILWNVHHNLSSLQKFVFKTIRDTLKSFLFA